MKAFARGIRGNAMRWKSDLHFRGTTTSHPIIKKPVVLQQEVADEQLYGLEETWVHPVWDVKEMAEVKQVHVKPSDFVDKVALFGVRLLRFGFDFFSGYSFGPVNEAKFIRRALFLETVAGIPGMVAGSIRHLDSLRKMKHDKGWIHTLLEEAENERMHMLVFLKIGRPTVVLRFFVVIAQGIMWNMFFSFYLVSPRLCHRFVGYLEEEAVKTYSHALEEMEDGGRLNSFGNQAAPQMAIEYWRLPSTANVKLMVQAIRADEANHRDVNHTFSEASKTGQDTPSPYVLKSS